MAVSEPIPDHVNRISKQVVDAAFKVHRALGPGLLESVYETCLLHELIKAGLSCQGQKIIPIHYDGEVLDAGLRLDVLVEDCLIIEIKAVETWNKVYDAQMLT